MSQTIEVARISSDVEVGLGNVLLASSSKRLVSFDYDDHEPRFLNILKKRFGRFRLVEVEDVFEMGPRLAAYAQGDAKAFDDVPLETGGTAFQSGVWQALRQIPWGETWTYGQLARHVGQPTAYRAVGRTNGLNPIAIILPCHRVVGSSGKLTGYAGGIWRKRALLKHEGSLSESPLLL